MEQFLIDRIPKGWKNKLFRRVKRTRTSTIKTFEEKKDLYRKNVKYRRNRLIKVKTLLGGECSICGYKKNWGALTLHHTEPKLKTFVVNTSTIENYNWNILETEFKKCILLCSNCHIELHHPQLGIPQDVGDKEGKGNDLVAVKLT